jgi:lipopolysaccharide/colanic/teichoic acid biosynthesis glycosyltransferase
MTKQNNLKSKRLLDFLIVLPSCLVLLPLMGIIWVAIKLTSKGPALFRQLRIGKDGRQFTMLKFRTMRADINDSNITKTVNADGSLPALEKMKNDPRVTGVGKFLRKTSLDELPQLFNIIAGSMSLVGPRPLMVFMINMNDSRAQKRQSVLPGITGYWQISARDQNTSVESMYVYDLKYVEEVSAVTDIKIIIRTIPAVLFGGGAW